MPNLKQPKSLKIFFLTEMWERYGFYVIQTLLALYLVQHFNWPDKKIYELVGSFTAITYLTPFIGGLIADKLLGQKPSIILGGGLLLLSYILLSLSEHETWMIRELALIAVGTGLLKPNISSLLGAQYDLKSHLREHGFTIFYLGITTGIILGTSLPSAFHRLFGWKIAFLSAAIGMFFSLASFTFGLRQFKISNTQILELRAKNISLSVVSILITWILAQSILLNPTFANILFPIIGLSAFLYLIQQFYSQTENSKHMAVIIFLCIMSVIFWSFYFQMFMSLTLFITRVVQDNLWGWQFPPPYYVTVESLGMLLVGYYITRHRNHKMIHTEYISSALNKFLFALFCMILAYALIVNLCFFDQNNHKISVLLLIPSYLLISIGEIFLSPVGLSTISLLSKPNKVSRFTGIFFVTLGLGGYLSGQFSNITSLETTHLSISQLKIHYGMCFFQIAVILLFCILLSLILMYGIKLLLRPSESD